MRASDAAIFAVLAIVAGAGCETAQRVGGDVVYELNPFGATDLTVYGVEVVGPYLLAELGGRRERLRVVAPANDGCAALLRPEARLRYAKSGTFGRVESDDDGCNLTGVASLAEWRDRQPRRRGGLVPRATARFTTLAETPSTLLLRGRFPLAAKIGIPASYDLVALVPNDAPCRAAAERGEASLEFRPAGSMPFRILVDGASCVVTGFAIPLSAP